MFHTARSHTLPRQSRSVTRPRVDIRGGPESPGAPWRGHVGGAFRSWAARVEQSWRCPLFTVRPLRRGHSVVDYSAPPRGPACHSSVGRHRARAAFPALGVQRRELRPLPVRSAQSRDGPAPVHRACPVVPGALPGDGCGAVAHGTASHPSWESQQRFPGGVTPERVLKGS